VSAHPSTHDHCQLQNLFSRHGQQIHTHQNSELATCKILSLVGIPGTVCTFSVNGFLYF